MVSQAITVTVSHQIWCKASQQKPIVVRGQSGDHHNSFSPELVQSFAEKPNGRMQSGMFCSALRQLPIKACNLLSCDGRETLSISYKIEVQLNKKVSKITPRKTSFFCFGYWCKVSQQKPIVIRGQSGDHRNSFTPELVQSFAAKTSSHTWSVRRSP